MNCIGLLNPTQRLLPPITPPLNLSLIPLYYSYTISANISYARATLSLSENLHLQKEVLLIHNNSFYIRKLFFSVIGRVRKRNIIVRCRHTNSQTSILNERHLLFVFFSSAIFKCRQLLFICEKHYAGIPNN